MCWSFNETSIKLLTWYSLRFFLLLIHWIDQLEKYKNDYLHIFSDRNILHIYFIINNMNFTLIPSYFFSQEFYYVVDEKKNVEILSLGDYLQVNMYFEHYPQIYAWIAYGIWNIFKRVFYKCSWIVELGWLWFNRSKKVCECKSNEFIKLKYLWISSDQNYPIFSNKSSYYDIKNIQVNVMNNNLNSIQVWSWDCQYYNDVCLCFTIKKKYKLYYLLFCGYIYIISSPFLTRF